jgi:hypothetical protein
MLHASLQGRQVRALLAAAVITALVGLAPAPAARADSAADAAQAEQLARGGQHAAAARLYEQSAKRGLLSWDPRLALLAAREYCAARQFDDADRLLGKAEGIAHGDDAVLLARVEAEIALGRNDPQRAVAALRTLPNPLPAPQATYLLALRGQAELAAGETMAGIRSFVERGRIVGTAEGRKANDRMLADELLQHGASARVPADATELERGWLDYAQLLSSAGGADPKVMAQRAQDWRARHPGHPAAAFLPGAAAAGPVTATLPATDSSPGTIALLLPLSGRQAQAGVAVRDGFLGAWYSAPDATRPRVRVYDTAASSAVAAYKQATSDGARFVVGPLTREDVAAMTGQPLPVPTLALNASPTEPPPAFLYQFALDPEQEARAVARRIAADGHVRGFAMVPNSPWGQRVEAAFADELRAIGTVSLTSIQHYDAGAKDFSAPLRAALGRFAGAGDRAAGTHATAPPKRDAAAEELSGPQFAFVAASPQAARALKPQLRFQMTYDLPMYATSDAWDASVRAAGDMDGLVFPEMPWILNGGAGAPELWEAVQTTWSAESRGRLRLYAFGGDAFRIANELRGNARTIGIAGLTGELEVGRDGRVQRRLEFARVEGGRPQPAGTASPLPAPSAGPGER